MKNQRVAGYDLATARRVDALCDEFERARRRGDRSDLAGWLARAGDVSPWLLPELARIDLECRLAADEAARAEEYFERFPALRADPTARAALADAEGHKHPGAGAGFAAEPSGVYPAAPGGDRVTGYGLRPAKAPGLVRDERTVALAALDLLDPPQEAGEIGRLDGYPVAGVVGAGGMGVVLRAYDLRLQRPVAIKVMKRGAAALPNARERFLREARVVAALEHDRIVPVYHVGEARGVPYLVMPLLRGESLAAYLRREPRLPPAEAVRLGREMAEGLAVAHARGLVHRDFKPANVWLVADADDTSRPRHVKLLDFGLTKPDAAGPVPPGDRITENGVVVGTPDYMAPEQALGCPAAATNDLFSLGVVLFEMSTGRRPIGPDGAPATFAAEPPEPRALCAAVPERLSSLIRRLLAFAPEARPRTADEVVSALRALEGTAPDTAAADPPPEALRTDAAQAGACLRDPRPRRRARAVAAAATVLALAGSAAWLIANSSPPFSVATPKSPAGRPAFKGGISVHLSSPKYGKFNLPLREPGALPARNGDLLRVEASVRPAAFLYVVAIDEDGQASPVYPWQPGRWGTRPAEERRVTEVSLPLNQANGWTISGANGGMISLVMLARNTRLDQSDDVLRHLLDGVPPQRPLPRPDAAVWFEDGREVRDGAETLRSIDYIESPIDGPVARLRSLIADKLQPLAKYTCAVSFAKAGG